MDPYTPRTRPGHRKKNIGLSTKEYTKITSTIASVRRKRMSTQQNDAEEEAGLDAAIANESSFIAEASFVRAPLNSRVGGSSGKGKARQDSLDSVPLEIQEALILEDLLFVLMGIEGEYIRYHPDYSPEDDDPLRGIEFVINPSLGAPRHVLVSGTSLHLPDTSLRDLVERILPLGTYYTAIYAFVEHRSHLDYGLVNHALCAAIRDMLKDYQTLLSQLEHAFSTSPVFSLQKLWFYCAPDNPHPLDDTGSSNSLLSDDEDEEVRARNKALGIDDAALDELGAGDSSSSIYVKGGEVLAIIYERMQNMAGDPTAHTIYNTLLRAAGKPYVEMLRRWVTTGKLVDPSKFIDRGILEMDYTDDYWERRYTLRDGSTSSGSKRHLTGVPSPRSVGGRLPGGACIPPLLEGWKHKILSLGNTLMSKKLIPRLRSLKRYFFLSQASFLHSSPRPLCHENYRNSHAQHLSSNSKVLLDLALSNDARGEDALYKEDVKVTMASEGLYDFLLTERAAAAAEQQTTSGKRDKGMLAIDALTFDYTCQVPLSLVISRRQYRAHVEMSLSTMWIEQKTVPWRCRLPHHSGFEKWRLRQILSFATKLEAKLERVTTVDQLLRDHMDYLETCMKECMLTSSKLLKAYSKLIVTCSTFALYTSSFTKSANSAIQAVEETGEDTGMAKRWDILGKFETHFNHWFQVHLDCVQFYASSENVSLLPLVVRLNSVKAGFLG
ncbi:gamma-tubulin complex component 2 [Ephemerocybe angulata]|uniref:Spindle pole body component n=1 Tax=Ephemerocybe angulata TaxID=980116 RepID=A0A8H6M363_9AGAR|nr:gamma-tubulin complex component 2 [Tulosesus angulatus]